ncbi:MAG: autotransporter outer membrane beta-barrel domain-containing protein [Anaerobiospirillum succiniciproducens]|uniref:beta strand repeat-containing protein n=1 Tax=Anaerobiospirillum succiniciproducens TaxID=13335 RepID=UPI002A74EB0E|nr:autotransporter outer membrane beta-barrel domain-containing protein [Anaerobiospirillum succiniciproducens]MDY2797994.1 autotransporter outer membrane beta-barrel domain-containing protein [Anaerobiospirillum succiniciproducens]
MKQTNNAIKFLMAQYRAIFKNANIAMVAAMAAAALAAGQAQAATDSWTNLSGSETISADTTYSGGNSNANANGFDLTITSGTLAFKGDTAAGNFSMSGDKTGRITLNGDNAAIKIGGNNVSGAAVKVTSFTGSAGSLTIGGSDQASSLEAATINLQGAAPEKAGAVTFPVNVTLAKSGALGGATSDITVATGAKIVLDQTSDGASIAGNSLTLNGGVLTVDGNKNLKISSKKVDVQAGSEVSFGSGSVTFDEATEISFAAQTLKNAGTIALGTLNNTRSVNLTVGADAFNTQLFKGTAKVTFTGTQDRPATLTIKATGSDELDLVGSGLFKANTGGIDKDNALNATASGDTVNIAIEGENAKLASDLFDAGSDFKSVKAKFGTLTVGKADSNNAFTVKAGEITVSSALTHAKAGQGILISGGTLNLDGVSGTVTAKSLDVGDGSAKGTLNIKNGAWSIPSLTMVSGDATVDKATVTLQKDAVLTTKNNDNKLTLTSSTLDVTAGKVQLAESGAALNTGSKLSIAKDQLFTASGDTATLTSDQKTNKVVTNSLETDGTGVLEIMNAGTVSAALAADLKTKLGYKGFIQFGGDSSITPSTDTTVNYSNAGDMTILGVYDNTQVVMDSNNDISKSVAAGSIKLNNANATGVVKAQSLILSNAQGTGGGKFVQTSDGQKVGNLQLSGAASSATLNGAGAIGNIDGDKAGSGSLLIGSAAYGKPSAVEVQGAIGGANAVGKIEVAADSSLTVKAGEGKGNITAYALNLKAGSSLDATGHDVTIGEGTTNVANIDGGTLNAKTLTLSGTGEHKIAGGANVVVETLNGAASGKISVGQDVKNGTASVKANTLLLKGATLNIDPVYGDQYASVIANTLSTTSGDTLDGLVNVGHNALFAVGFDTKAEVDAVLGTLVKNGSFTDPTPSVPGPTTRADSSAPGAEVVAPNAVVLNKGIKFTGTSGIYVGTDATKTASGNNLTVDAGSALVVTDKVFTVDPATGKKTGAAITANGGTGGNAAIALGANLVLVGAFNGADNELDILNGFTDAAAQLVNFKFSIGGSDLLVVSVVNGKLDVNLTQDEAKLASAFAGASTPVKQFLLDMLAGEKYVYSTSAGYQLINELAMAGNGTAADAAAHAATYAGAQQAAVASVTTMADAMFGRVGAVGVEAASIAATGSQANGGVWLTPMYKSVDSDGFNAQGASYGSDVDLSGVAFGADTVNGNMRFGAVFNIGSGDSEGKGNGNGLKDEFDYYGFGIYSAMGFGNFALVGDASMTVISHEVEGLGLKGKADTTAVTMGVTGQYTVSTPAVDVTPHLGARFIRLNTDSYDLTSANGVVGTTDFDVQNVFSVPLGVTLSKAFVAGGWSLAPSADLTIAFNTGDTDAKSTTRFTGINNNLDLTAEVLDEVQYGLTVGLGAQYGAFGTSFGINYTGSENTDAFGVNAQARYMF